MRRGRARARRGESRCARRCGRRDRPARRAPAACRRRSPGAAPARPARCRWSRPCATARRASGSTGAARRSRACARSASRVHVGERQHLAAVPVLHDARHEAALVVDDLLVDRLAVGALIAHDCRSRRTVARGLRRLRDCRRMQSLLDRKLIVVTGKGGVGKTTIAAALGLLAAERGRAHDRRRGRRAARAGRAVRPRRPPSRARRPRLPSGLWSISIDPDRALLEWLQALGGRVSGGCSPRAAPSSTSPPPRPGAKELVSMVKIWQLDARAERAARGAATTWWSSTRPPPATRSGMLRSPRTFGAIARVGPDRRTDRATCSELLERPERAPPTSPSPTAPRWPSPRRSSCRTGLHERARARARRGDRQRRCCRGASARAELDAHRGAARAPRPREERRDGSRPSASSAAARAARAVHERARFQHSQVARLRRRGFEVLALPFVWAPASSTSRRSRRIAARGSRRSSGAAEPQRRLGDPEPVEQALVGAPVAAHAHRQVEVHVRAELPLELRPRGGADRLDHAPAARRPGSPSASRSRPRSARARASGPSRGAFDLLDDDLDRVRHLLEGAPDRPPRGSARRAARSRGWSEARLGSNMNGPSGISAARCSTSAATPAPRARRDREHLAVELELGGLLRAPRRSARAREPVDLVDRDRHGHAAPGERRAR